MIKPDFAYQGHLVFIQKMKEYTIVTVLAVVFAVSSLNAEVVLGRFEIKDFAFSIETNDGVDTVVWLGCRALAYEDNDVFKINYSRGLRGSSIVNSIMKIFGNLITNGN